MTLFDLAWLLPRTIGAEDKQADPLPRSELEVMRLLGRRPGTNVNTVARDLGLKPSNVSATVRSLVERGLVEKRADPADGRQVLLHLTATARSSRERRERLWGEALTSVLGDLAPEDRTHLVAALPALRAFANLLSDAPA